MYEIFISYSNEDKVKAEKTVKRLEDEGMSCWIASRDILINANYSATISQAILNAKLILVLISDHSVESKFVHREICLAVENNLPVFPVFIENTELKHGLDFLLAGVQKIGPCADEEGLLEQAVCWLNSFFKVQSSDPRATDSVKIDIYDSHMEYVGSALKKKVHSLGLWHKTFHCWIYDNENGTPMIWVQRRSSDRSDFPMMLDITVGRHLLESETDRDAAKRLSDEIGIRIPFEKLSFIGVHSFEEKIGDFINNELNSVFLYRYPYSLDRFIPESTNISPLVEIKATDMLRLFKNEIESAHAIEMTFKNGRRSEEIEVSLKDFVPHDTQYYIDICLAVMKKCESSF